MTARLVTITVSHFCEKARWALDRAGVRYREDAHLPGLHLVALRSARRLEGARGAMTPILVEDGRAIADSTRILLYLEPRTPAELRLHPRGPREREEVLALEDRFDEGIGPQVRRIAYHHLVHEARELLGGMLDAQGPRWQRAVVRLVRDRLAGALHGALDLSAERTAESKRELDAVLAESDARLADGRRWLTGDRFTAADLTLAALLSPLLAPPEHPFPYAPAERMPPALRALSERIAASPTGRLALRAYREERRRTPGG